MWLLYLREWESEARANGEALAIYRRRPADRDYRHLSEFNIFLEFPNALAVVESHEPYTTFVRTSSLSLPLDEPHLATHVYSLLKIYISSYIFYLVPNVNNWIFPSMSSMKF